MSEAFYGGDFGAILHHRQREAGVDRSPVEQHGAGAALAMVAAFLGSCQMQPVAQGIQQRRPRCDLKFRFGAVDEKGDDNLLHGWCRPI